MRSPTLLPRATKVGMTQRPVQPHQRQHTIPTAHNAWCNPTTPNRSLAGIDRHNLHYWRGGDFIGIGPGACSRLTNTTAQRVALMQVRCTRLQPTKQATATATATDQQDLVVDSSTRQVAATSRKQPMRRSSVRHPDT
jgi:hypothetical protein